MINNFDELYTTFLKAVKSINEALSKGDSPFLRAEIKRFRRDIEAPMDAAWRSLNKKEKEIFLEREAKNEWERHRA